MNKVLAFQYQCHFLKFEVPVLQLVKYTFIFLIKKTYVMNLLQSPKNLDLTKKVLRTLLIFEIGITSLVIVRFVLFS